jgi:histone H3/H4
LQKTLDNIFGKTAITRIGNRAGVQRIAFKELESAGPDGTHLLKHIAERFARTVMRHAADFAEEDDHKSTIQMKHLLTALELVQNGPNAHMRPR